MRNPALSSLEEEYISNKDGLMLQAVLMSTRHLHPAVCLGQTAKFQKLGCDTTSLFTKWRGVCRILNPAYRSFHVN